MYNIPGAERNHSRWTRLDSPGARVSPDCYSFCSASAGSCVSGDAVTIDASSGKTIGQLAKQLREQATRDPRSDAPAQVVISYAHSMIGARLVAAGYVTDSRIYPLNRAADPFAYPKRVRCAALARFGFDFDDEAAYARALDGRLDEDVVGGGGGVPALLSDGPAARPD